MNSARRPSIAILACLALIAVGCRSSDDADLPGPTAPVYTNVSDAGRTRLAPADSQTRFQSPDGTVVAIGQTHLTIGQTSASPTTAFLEWHTYARSDSAGTEIQILERRDEDDPTKGGTLGGDFVFPRPEIPHYFVVSYGPIGAMEPLAAGNAPAAVRNGQIHGTLTTADGPGDLTFSGYVWVECYTRTIDDWTVDDPTFSSDFCKPYAYLAGERPPVTSPTKTE